MLRAQAPLQAAFGFAVSFAMRGRVTVGVQSCALTGTPVPLQLPETPLQALPSPRLWEPLLSFAS